MIREDDREEVIRNRLDAYERQTQPVVEYYKAQGRLIVVNADRPVDEVRAEIFGVMTAMARGHCGSGPSN